MPPASLSTLDVIRPGPMTASNTARRRRVTRVRRRKSFPRFDHVASAPELALVSFIALDVRLGEFLLQLTHNVVHGDRADRMLFGVHHREAAQVVLVEKLEHVFIAGI